MRIARRALFASALAVPAGGQTVSAELRAALAPTGVLRAGFNLGNFLLVNGRDAAGDPAGVAPDMARAIAERLGVPLRAVSYARPGMLADAVGTDAWDVALLGAEPQRAARIAFSPAYVEIEATYLLPAGSALESVAAVDRPGVRVAAPVGAAYTLWLERNLRQATLVLDATPDASRARFLAERLDALAGLRPGLLTDAAAIPGATLLPGRFMAVQQAIGVARENALGAAFLRDFVEEAKASGLVARAIARHGVQGLTVAAPA